MDGTTQRQDRAPEELRPHDAQRLTRLAQAALALVDAQDVGALITVVAEQGLAALGCAGGSVAVPDPDDPSVLVSHVTSSYGEQVQADYVRLSVDDALPVCVAARERRTVLLPDGAASAAFSPGMAAVNEATGSVAWASVPLVAGDRLLGVLTAGWERPQGFAADQVALLHAFAAQCAQALARVEALAERRSAAAAVARMSESLQRSLLTEVPQPDHLQLVSRYVPAAEQAQVGGDWYDAFMVGDGSMNLVVGDVSGHDRQAAVAMAQVRNVLRGVAHALVEPPAAVLSALDRAMHDLAVGALATAVLARVEQGPAEAERGERVLRWSNAGHPPPLLIEPGGRARLLVDGTGTAGVGPDLLLGMASGVERHDHVRTLVPGATVVLYTDGLVERRGEDLDVSLERLRRAGERLGGLDLNELCDALLRESGVAGGERAEDDVAVLALRAHREDTSRPAAAGPRVLPADLRRRREEDGGDDGA